MWKNAKIYRTYSTVWDFHTVWLNFKLQYVIMLTDKKYKAEGLFTLERGRMRRDKVKLDKIVGSNIRRERDVRKLTRDELAELIDLTVSHLGLIERGERGATPVVLNKICGVLGVTADYLFTERSRAVSAREQDENDGDVYRRKVDVLVAQLNESELEYLSHVIKGIIKLRKNESPSNSETDTAE